MHSAETIYAEVSNIRERHPMRGIEGIRKTLLEEQGMRITRLERKTEFRMSHNKSFLGQFLQISSKP